MNPRTRELVDIPGVIEKYGVPPGRLRDLQALTGDKVVREDGRYGEVKDITCWSKKTPAYNLILGEGAHTYFADGYLAHNKGAAFTCANGTRPLCGVVAENQGHWCTAYATTCSGMMPSKYAVTSLASCGEQGTCMLNCACCNAGEARACSATTYVNAPYTVYDPTANQKTQCATANDEWISGSVNCFWASEDDEFQK